MPDLSWNTDFWNSPHNWRTGGEEWSDHWGGSEAQWFGSLLPRLHRLMPTGQILEIAPGFGRWTKFLLPACQSYLGIDLSAESVSSCREMFSAVSHASFAQNDGQSLGAAADGTFDLVFSFDSLVHAELDILELYIPQIVKKLTPQGCAFIHHSNLLSFGGSLGEPHARSRSVSAEEVARVILTNDGAVLIQEIINWGGEHLHDCLTTFCRHGSSKATHSIRIENPRFMDEADIIREKQAPYSRI